MPELMYFFIVKDFGGARVVRECADMRAIEKTRPSGTIFEMSANVELGDTDQWDEINKRLASEARRLGIPELHNLYPPKDMVRVAKLGAKIRKRMCNNPL